MRSADDSHPDRYTITIQTYLCLHIILPHSQKYPLMQNSEYPRRYERGYQEKKNSPVFVRKNQGSRVVKKSMTSFLTETIHDSLRSTMPDSGFALNPRSREDLSLRYRLVRHKIERRRYRTKLLDIESNTPRYSSPAECSADSTYPSSMPHMNSINWSSRRPLTLRPSS